MTRSVNKHSNAGVVGAAVAAAARAAGAGGRSAVAGIWVVWMRGTQVWGCESISRLDHAGPVTRPDGIAVAVVVAVAPSRLSEPVIGRARVLADYLDGQGLAVYAAHACTLHPGALWTSLRGPAAGGVLAPNPEPSVSQRPHRWLPGFGICAHPQLRAAALAPLAAVVLTTPVAHAAPPGQPGLIAEPAPGQAGVTAPAVPEAPAAPQSADPGNIEPGAEPAGPAPESSLEPMPAAPQPDPEPLPVTYEEPDHQPSASQPLLQPTTAPEPEPVAEPYVPAAPPSEPVEATQIVVVEPEPVAADPQPVGGTEESGIGEPTFAPPLDETGECEGSLQVGGVSVPQPEWMSAEAGAWAQDWNDAVTTQASNSLGDFGMTEPTIDTALGIGTEPVPLAEVTAPVLEAIPQPIVQEVKAAVSEPAAELEAVVEAPVAQMVSEVLVQWPPTLG